MPGHTAAQCEHFIGNCNLCGQWGHRAANCPQQKGVNEITPRADSTTQAPTVTHPVIECLPCNSSGSLGSLSPCITLGKTLQFTQEMRNQCLGRLCTVSTQQKLHSLTTPGINSVKTPALTDTREWVDVIRGTKKFCPKSHKLVTASSSYLALQQNQEGNNGEPVWELIEFTVDSGACDWVANRNVAKAIQITPTEAPKAGVWYRSACGTKIFNEGEKIVRGYSTNGSFIDVTWQIAEVTNPLGSVVRMMETESRVVFERNTDRGTWGYIEYITSGQKVDITHNGNALVMQM